jgi:hypothetical protein
MRSKLMSARRGRRDAPFGARPLGVVPPLGGGCAGRPDVNDFNDLQPRPHNRLAGRAGRERFSAANPW